jgi:hypothetical protein
VIPEALDDELVPTPPIGPKKAGPRKFHAKHFRSLNLTNHARAVDEGRMNVTPCTASRCRTSQVESFTKGQGL